jgi:hypothetical protein
MSSYHLVVARYQENLEWIEKMDNSKSHIFIYNKGPDVIENTIPRKNIGREAETFFYHILQYYHDLPDYMILVQGHPFDHMENIDQDNFQTKIDYMLKNIEIDNIYSLFTRLFTEEHYWNEGLKTIEYLSHFFEGEKPQINIFSAGCQYIIPKANILSRPIQFYMHIYAMILNTKTLTSYESHYNGVYDHNSIDGWVLERLFMYLFMKEIPISARMKRKRYLITGVTNASSFTSSISNILIHSLAKTHQIILINDEISIELFEESIRENIYILPYPSINADSLFQVGYVDRIFHCREMDDLFSGEKEENIREKTMIEIMNIVQYANTFRYPIPVGYSLSANIHDLSI